MTTTPAADRERGDRLGVDPSNQSTAASTWVPARVQDRDAGIGRLGEDQRELRAAEDDPIDALLVTQAGDDLDQPPAALVRRIPATSSPM